MRKLLKQHEEKQQKGTVDTPDQVKIHLLDRENSYNYTLILAGSCSGVSFGSSAADNGHCIV